MIYKITYPNGKIYIGKDLTDTATYFGSVNSELIRSDFSQGELDDFSVRKEVSYWSLDTNEINKLESEFILKFGSNNPEIGYYRWPKLSP